MLCREMSFTVRLPIIMTSPVEFSTGEFRYEKGMKSPLKWHNQQGEKRQKGKCKCSFCSSKSFYISKKKMIKRNLSYVCKPCSFLRRRSFGSSRNPPQRTSPETSGKNVDQSQHASRSGKCTLDLEKFLAGLQKRSEIER